MVAVKKIIKIHVEDEDNDVETGKKSVSKPKTSEIKASTEAVAKKRKVSKAKVTRKKKQEEKEVKPKTATKKIAPKKIVEKEEVQKEEMPKEEVKEIEKKDFKKEAREEILKKIEEKPVFGKIEKIEEKPVARKVEKIDLLASKGNSVKNTISSFLVENKIEEVEPKKEESWFKRSKKEVPEVSQPEVVQEEVVEEVAVPDMKVRRSVKLYRKIALSFILLTAVLLAAVFYFSFTKVTISLIPNQERISNNMIFDVYDEKNTEIPDASVKGIVKVVPIEDTQTYPATQEEVIGKEAIGTVTIINNYNKNQPLVASTRLLSADGKLFRVKNTVNVPAGGSIDVEVYADEPSPEMAIGPSKFTIPGLWAGLQDKIYGESKSAMVYRQKVKKNIGQEDIDNAERDLKVKLLAKAKTDIEKLYSDYSQIIFKVLDDSAKSATEAKVGDEKDDFSMSMKANVVVVAFNDAQAVELAKQKFIVSLPENKEIVSFDQSNIIYSLNNYNELEGSATINASFEGKTSLKENSNIVDVQKILGLNDKQLNAYLSGLTEIAGFEVKYYPTFIQRVPKLIDRVNVEIKK